MATHPTIVQSTPVIDEEDDEEDDEEEFTTASKTCCYFSSLLISKNDREPFSPELCLYSFPLLHQEESAGRVQYLFVYVFFCAMTYNNQYKTKEKKLNQGKQHIHQWGGKRGHRSSADLSTIRHLS